MNPSFAAAFAGRSVFVTGHTGFKGSWLALWLSRMGAHVTGYSLAPPTNLCNFHASGICDVLAANHEADIRDREKLSKALRSAKPDFVFHLAAQSLVRESYRAPHETFDVNIMGTACLLECLRMLGHPCVIVAVTSDKCYENQEQNAGYKETDPMGGFDPYSASKGAAELVIASYRRSFFNPARLKDHGVKLSSARAGNVIGGGDWAPDRIGTDTVNALSAGKPVPVRNPQAIRPWQHVLEPLSGYLSLAARMQASDEASWCGAWNFGPPLGEQTTVLDLVKLYCVAWEKGTWQEIQSPAAPHEAGILRLSIEKAARKLRWRPRWTVAEAVARAVAWHKAYCRSPGACMRKASEADIAAYESAPPLPVCPPAPPGNQP